MNSKQRTETLILVGALPPPTTGQALAFEMLVKGINERKIPYKIVNISSKKKVLDQVASWGRMSEYIIILLEYMCKVLFRNNTVYIIIAQSRRGFFRDLFMIWIARMNRNKIICHLHGGNYDNFYRSQPKWLRWLIRKTLLQVNDIIVLGEKLRGNFNFEPRLRENIQVIPNGFPFKNPPVTLPKKLPKTGDEPIHILFLSNLIESKGYLEVLKSIKILVKENGINVQSYFCGTFMANPSDDDSVENEEHARQIFENYIKKHELMNNVYYCGSVTADKKINMLTKAHFFVLPTNYNNEGQPLSIIEAMAYGNVVISTDYRAIPDMIVNNVTGFLLPSRHPQLIADAVLKTISDPKRYSSMSEASIEYYKKHFTYEKHLGCMIPLLLKYKKTC
jgi:glycosyltransferase involved in cell wall biosynthesis